MNAPVIYNAHPQTLEYIGQGVADPDPLDAEHWLIPGYAYTDSPPEPVPGHTVVRDLARQAWALVEDNRGTVYDVATGEPKQHQALGALPPELTRQPFPGDFHYWDGSAWVLDVDAQKESIRTKGLSLRDERLANASMRIAPLQDAVDLGEASAHEQEALLAWKRYRIALNRLDQQPGYPLSIDWPSSPEDATAPPPQEAEHTQ
ncbi:tail fiber assembly protein [Pseudomonas wadenswilerensis]|uniref:Tail fiber assembly protein homolog from lambdoid prophage Qin n=1 Tax=Pseudomonas wadenswilerensis TaxID=1785161 RepID=A0A380SYV4_9PSED|nr:tail fiber assembly protein [Pseudomonas wadenswilerensis]SUQ63179.1 Tail fiber assembly protein homolog from lambdoid prophage Qin [Pseudomonas wadenswilerensis]